MLQKYPVMKESVVLDNINQKAKVKLSAMPLGWAGVASASLPPDQKMPLYPMHWLCIAMVGLCFLYAFFPQSRPRQQFKTHSTIRLPLPIGPTLPSVSELAPAVVLGPESVPQMIAEAEKKKMQTSSELGQWQTQTTQVGDSLSKILETSGMKRQDIQRILKHKSVQLVRTLSPGSEYRYLKNQQQEITDFIMDTQPGKYLQLIRHRKGPAYMVQIKEHPLEKKLIVKTATLDDSILASARKAGLDKQIIKQMMDLIHWDQGTAIKPKKHDSLKILYEEKYHKGKKVETGQLLAFEIKNPKNTVQLVRFTDKRGNSGFFTPDGLGLEKPFLRNPVQASRISSRYGKRYHPLFHTMKHHCGVDFAAPYGTPIKAAGDAKVIFMGHKPGYGKVVELRHSSKYTTVYAHMSGFFKGLSLGSRVTQGQVIGFVGATGSATGPHLHYEFRINGMHRDPLTVVLPRTKTLDPKSKKDFVYHARHMLRLME